MKLSKCGTLNQMALYQVSYQEIKNLCTSRNVDVYQYNTREYLAPPYDSQQK